MQYIIFMLTIQLPFIYLVWKFFKNYESKSFQAVKTLSTQTRKTAAVMDMLRMSLEKSTEDVYSRLKAVEGKPELIESRIYQLEKYTGLRSNSPSINNPSVGSSLSSLDEKDFS